MLSARYSLLLHGNSRVVKNSVVVKAVTTSVNPSSAPVRPRAEQVTWSL